MSPAKAKSEVGHAVARQPRPGRPNTTVNMTAPASGCSDRPGTAERGLLVADLDVAQGEEGDQLPVAPQLVEAERPPALGRPVLCPGAGVGHGVPPLSAPAPRPQGPGGRERASRPTASRRRYPPTVETVTGLARRSVRRAHRRAAQALVRAARVQEHIDPAGGTVALTFDDGPDPRHTPAILDELARLGITGTFFLVGRRARAHPALVRRILAEGHAVGSHSDSHSDPWRVPFRGLARDYRRGRSEVEWAAGRPVPLFRPPKGYVDGAGAAAMLAARLRPWLWTIDPRDWEPGVRPDAVVARLAGLQQGDVVLLHDGIEGPLAPSALDRSATRQALAGIAALAAERGLGFATLG